MQTIDFRVARPSWAGVRSGADRTDGLSRRTCRFPLSAKALLFAAIGIQGVLTLEVAHAQSGLAPSTAFIQAGWWKDTRVVTAGLTWEWGNSWSLGRGRLGGHWELSASRWSYPSMDGRREAWLGQVGIVPTFRYRWNDGTSPWFVEAGIGVSWTTTLYQTQHKRFSTTFNFADHVGFGWNFGPSREHELSLRLEHFSNAGIKHPNPGQNLVELRYSFAFR